MRPLGKNLWTSRSWLRLLGIVTALIVMMEGAAIMYLATPIHIEGIGGILERSVMIGGGQLFFLGAFLFLHWLLKGHPILGRDFFGHWLVHLLAALAALLIIIEGIVLALYAGDLRIEGIGGVRAFWMVGAGCQLFILGWALLFSWLAHREGLNHTNWSKVVAFLSGAIASAQGLFIIGNAAPITIDDAATISQGSVTVAGLQLFLLGAILSCLWAFRGFKLRGRNYLAIFPFNVIPLLVSEVIAVEGLILVAFASPLSIGGIGGIREFWVVAAGSQLFFLGTISSLAWFWRERKPWGTRASTIPSLFAASLLMAEGVFIMGVSAPIVVESIGGMLSRTVTLAGAQLFAIGLIVVIYWILKDRTVLGRDITNGRVLRFTPLVLGAIVALEGLVLIAYKSPVTLDGVGVIRGAWMVLAGAQLVLLGSVISLSWFWGNEIPARINLTRATEVFLAALIIAEGVFVMGNAADVRFEGFGGVGAMWVAAAGVSLVLLGGVILMMRKIGWISPFSRRLRGMPLSQFLIYGAWCVVAIEGLVLASLASDMWIEGFGGLSGRYVLLSSVQLVAVGLLGATFWNLRNRDLPFKIRQLAAMITVFLALLLGPAALF